MCVLFPLPIMCCTQAKVNELTQEVTSLNKQLDSGRLDNKRHCELLKDKASSKVSLPTTLVLLCTLIPCQDRANSIKIAELEAQLSKATSSAAHLKRAKEEVLIWIIDTLLVYYAWFIKHLNIYSVTGGTT